MKNEKQNDPTRAADSQDHRPVRDESATSQGFGRCKADIGDAAIHNIFATDGGWPGDGSGMDDLADFNQKEGHDM